jgi:hypothetical protein
LDKTASSAGQWLNIPSSHAAALAGAEVYKALGVGGNLHYINTPATSHCQWENTYNTHLQDFIQKFLHRTKPADGATPLFTATAPPNMTNWINWTTPALTGELGTGGGAVSGFALSAAASPAMGGTVNRAPSPPANGRYEEGATVTATAVPNDGWKFDGWGGDAAGANLSTAVTMDANKSIVAKFLPVVDGTENLVRDGNFPGTGLGANWALNQGSYFGNSAASASVSGGKVTINITASGAQTYQPQLVQQGIALEQGISYRLTFTASSAAARSINVMIQQSGGDYSQYAADDFDLTPIERVFTLEFKMAAASDPSAQLAFNAGGGAAQSVTISNVRLIYIADGQTSAHGNAPAGMAAKRAPALRVSAVSNGAIRVTFRAFGDGAAMITLYDLKGKLVSSKRLQASAGANYSHTFNTAGMASGFYIVRIQNSGRSEQARVVIPK